MAASTAEHNFDETQALWAQTVDRVKQIVIAPTLWRALEKTMPVIWEGDSFVVGFGAMDGQLASQLNTRDYRLAIERTLRDMTSNGALVLRVIEGTEKSDWEYVKARDAAAVASRTQVAEKRQKASAAYGSWDEVYDQVSRLWASFELRALPTGRGRYIDAALTVVEKAMDAGLYPTNLEIGAAAEELTERGLSRVVERIAGMTNSDPAIVAYLLFSRRRTAAVPAVEATEG